jgi:hypothetical protein
LEAVIERNRTAQGRLRRRKLESQLERAYRHAGSMDIGSIVPTSVPRQWPARDVALVEQIVSGGPGLYDLWESSPIRFDDDGAHTEAIIDALFAFSFLFAMQLTV